MIMTAADIYPQIQIIHAEPIHNLPNAEPSDAKRSER